MDPLPTDPPLETEKAKFLPMVIQTPGKHFPVANELPGTTPSPPTPPLDASPPKPKIGKVPGMKSPVRIILEETVLLPPSCTTSTVYILAPGYSMVVPVAAAAAACAAAGVPPPLKVTIFELPADLELPGAVCGHALALGPAGLTLSSPILLSFPECADRGANSTSPAAPRAYRYRADGTWVVDADAPASAAAEGEAGSVWAEAAALGIHALLRPASSWRPTAGLVASSALGAAAAVSAAGATWLILRRRQLAAAAEAAAACDAEHGDGAPPGSIGFHFIAAAAAARARLNSTVAEPCAGPENLQDSDSDDLEVSLAPRATAFASARARPGAAGVFASAAPRAEPAAAEPAAAEPVGDMIVAGFSNLGSSRPPSGGTPCSAGSVVTEAEADLIFQVPPPGSRGRGWHTDPYKDGAPYPWNTAPYPEVMYPC